MLEQVRAIEPDNGTIYNIAESDGSRNAIIQVHYGPGDVTVLDATVPAQSVWNLIQPYSSDGRLTARARQPYVRTRCGEVQYMNSDNATDTYFYFGPSEQELNKLIQVDEYLRFNNDSAPTLRQGELPLNSTIFWLRAPSSSSRHSVLMAYGNHWNDSNVDYWFFTGCTVDAVWANSDLNSTVAEGVSCVNVDEMYNDVTIWQESANWIDMDPSWAREVELLYRTTAGGRYEPSAVAALILALAVSGADPELDNATFTRYDRVRPAVQDPLLDYLKKNKLLQRYPDGNIWVYASDGWTNPATLMRVDVRFYHDGYGYDSSTVTVQLSLAVITIYLSAALAYVISTLWTGEVGSSWDSAGGVLLLGMNSKRPAHLGDTSAGIETLKTYKEPVNIRVNDENHLELVFANNASTRSTAYRRVVANHRY